MDTIQTIMTRRSYRGRYLPVPVPRADLETILEAGLAAPSGCNRQTTSLIAVDDPEILARIHSVIQPDVGETAPAAICVLTHRIFAYRDKCFAVQDYSAAIENMLLVITALGYHSCWYEGHITDDDRICDKIAAILGVPSEYDLVAFLPIGKAEGKPVPPKKKSMAERAFFNEFPSAQVRFSRYQPENEAAVCRFLTELNRGDPLHINWHWARWEWMVYHDEMDRDQMDKIGLWWAGNRVVGAAIYDMYPGEGCALWLPGYQHLAEEIVTYAGQQLRDENGFSLAVNVRDLRTKKLLTKLGYHPAEQTENLMVCHLNRLPHIELPRGYHFRELDPALEGKTMQWLMWQGFDHGDDRAECEAQTNPVPPHPHAKKELTLAVTDEAGQDAAFCSCWYQEGTGYAYVEPVCTIPSHRGRGLGRALVTETLARCAKLGAEQAFVISELDFYRTLGFRDAERYVFWGK